MERLTLQGSSKSASKNATLILQIKTVRHKIWVLSIVNKENYGYRLSIISPMAENYQTAVNCRKTDLLYLYQNVIINLTWKIKNV